MHECESSLASDQVRREAKVRGAGKMREFVTRKQQKSAIERLQCSQRRRGEGGWPFVEGNIASHSGDGIAPTR